MDAPDRLALLLAGASVGLTGGLVEELGWTGFALPRLLSRHGVLAAGLRLGVVWTAWHGLQMWWVGSTSSGGLPPAVFMPLYYMSALATLTAYRVLMVRAYDRTGSMLVATLMHASYIFTTLFVLAPPTTGAPFLIYSACFAAALWATVAAGEVIARRRRWIGTGFEPS